MPERPLGDSAAFKPSNDGDLEALDADGHLEVRILEGALLRLVRGSQVDCFKSRVMLEEVVLGDKLSFDFTARCLQILIVTQSLNDLLELL